MQNYASLQSVVFKCIVGCFISVGFSASDFGLFHYVGYFSPENCS